MIAKDQKRGLGRLLKSAAADAVLTGEDIFDQTEQDGAAKLLFAALHLVAKISRKEHESVVLLSTTEFPPEMIEASTTLYISAPTITGDHFDFAVFAYDHSGRLLGHQAWRRSIAEVEKTKSKLPELSTSGRGRRSKDVTAIRFTEAEVLGDPWGCAVKIFDWASWSFG
jgi:hypothetical protein